MALLIVDSFDGYSDISQKWPYYTVGNFGIDASYGRNSTKGARGWWSRGCQMRSIANKQTVYVGVAAKWSADSFSPAPILLWDTASNVQVMVVLRPWGAIDVYRGWGDALLSSSFANFGKLTSWHFYELKAVISTTVGQVTFRIDGVEYVNTAANLNTSRTGNAYTNMVGMNHSFDNIGVNCDFDDFYTDDAQFHGDCRVIACAPSGAGYSAAWTPSTGSNYACVDEVPPSTTDYVQTGDMAAIDAYAMTDISPSSGTIKAVAGNYYCKRLESGDTDRALGMLTRLSSTNLVSSGQVAPTAWGYLQFIQETKPGGGSWSVQDTKDAEMGMQIVA